MSKWLSVPYENYWEKSREKLMKVGQDYVRV